MKALIIEDSVDRVNLLTQMLASHDSVIADTVSGAIEFIRDFVFDLVFLDFDLGNGENSILIAKRMASLRDRPAVFIHSDNPQGAERLLAILPQAVLLPINEIVHCSVRVGILKSILANPLLELSILQTWIDRNR